MKSFKVICKCPHTFQDNSLGKNIRYANPTTKIYPDGMIEVRCTVCNSIHKVKKD